MVATHCPWPMDHVTRKLGRSLTARVAMIASDTPVKVDRSSCFPKGSLARAEAYSANISSNLSRRPKLSCSARAFSSGMMESPLLVM